MSGPLTITDLFTPLTAEQFRAKLVVELLSLQIPADKWRRGGVASTTITVCSILLALMSQIIVSLILGFFLPTATGEGLKALAFYVYGVTVPDASYASGNLRLTNTGGGVYTQAAGTYTALNPTNGATYINSAAFSIGANAIVLVPMRAVDAGSAGNAIPNAITVSVTPLLGVDITNPASLIGVDAPSDEAIRALCLNKLAAMSIRGPRTAYAYAIQVAINPTTMGPVNINRWSITEASHTNDVTLAVAAPSGAPDADDIVGIQTAVERYVRPSGVTATVVASTEEVYDPTISIWVTPASGTTTAQIEAAVQNRIALYIAAYPIGGVTAGDDTYNSFTGLFHEGITGAIGAGCSDVGATLLSTRGASDLALGTLQVATDSVAVNVILVAASSGVLV